MLFSSNIGYFDLCKSNEFINSNTRNTVLSFFHINIRSLNANYKKLQDLLNAYDTNFDVILLSEIWSTNIDFFNAVFIDYNFVFSPPKSQRAGGVGLLIKKNFNYNIINTSADVFFATLQNIWF